MNTAKSVALSNVTTLKNEPPDTISVSSTPEVESADMKQSAVLSPFGPTDLNDSITLEEFQPRKSETASAYEENLSWLLNLGCSLDEANMWIDNLILCETRGLDPKIISEMLKNQP